MVEVALRTIGVTGLIVGGGILFVICERFKDATTPKVEACKRWGIGIATVGFAALLASVLPWLALHCPALFIAQKVQVARYRAPGNAELSHEVRAVGQISAFRAFPNHLDHASDPVVLRP